jgi:hypothetical protein
LTAIDMATPTISTSNPGSSNPAGAITAIWNEKPMNNRP